MKMSRSHTIKFYALFMLALLGICLTPFVNQLIYSRRENQTTLASTPLNSQDSGNWGNSADPFHLDLNTYYILSASYGTLYATFSVVAREIYFVYLVSALFWTSELYNNSDFTTLLGMPYDLPFINLNRYMLFSPNHTGQYYLKLYSNHFDGKLAVLTAPPYTINTSQLMVISQETNPVEVLQFDAIQGNYSTPATTLYVKIARGWNYVVFPEMYGQFNSKPIYLENGSYSIIIEESCNFRLTGYLNLSQNQPVPPPPPPENKTDTGQGNSILNGITPVFGIGVIVGLCALYKFKKK